jgi:Fic family protein
LERSFNKDFEMKEHNIFRPRPITTIGEVSKCSDMTSSWASKDIENLIKLGMVQEITGK